MNINIDPYKKICKYKFCKQYFYARRTNQEFCCRDHYMKHNNLKAKEVRDNTKGTDSQFHKNRKILIHLERKTKVTLDELYRHGFKIGYYTTTKKNNITGKSILFYYEYYLEQIDPLNYKITKI